MAISMTKRKGNMWLQRVDDAQRFRKDKLTENVKRHLNLYKGNHWGAQSHFRNRDLVTVNITFPTVRNQVPNYYIHDPKWVIRPRDERSLIQAPIAENVMNYIWREIGAKRQMRLSIYDVLIFGHAIMEVGHRFETDVVKVKKERIFYNEYIRKDMPYIRRISPVRFLFDVKADYDPLINAEWCGKEVFKSIKDVKRDPGLKNTRDLEANLKNDEHQALKYGEDVVKLIEIHDRKNLKLLLFAEGYDRPLREIDHPYMDETLEGYNFEWLQFNHVPDEPFGISNVSLIEDQQQELNRTRTQMFTHRRRVSNRRYIYDEGSIGDRQIQKLEDAEGGAMVPVGSIDRIKPLEDARLSFDVPGIESVIKQDIRELTGLPASQFGVISDRRRPATELNQVEGARVNRTLDNRNLVDDFTNNIGRKLLQIIQSNMDRAQVIEIVGPRGAFWLEWTKEDIQGEFFTNIEPLSTTPEGQEIRRKQTLDIFGLFAKVPGFNLRRLSEEVFRAYNFSRIEEFYLPNFDQIWGAGPAVNPAPGNNTIAQNGQLQQQGPPNAVDLENAARQLG